MLRECRACSRAYDKWLDEKAEEADTVSKQLAVVSAMCDSCDSHSFSGFSTYRRNVFTSLLGPSAADWANGTPRCCHRGRALEYRSARAQVHMPAYKYAGDAIHPDSRIQKT